jgi:hypothetical protein
MKLMDLEMKLQLLPLPFLDMNLMSCALERLIAPKAEH